jgi:hypothetical protein
MSPKSSAGKQTRIKWCNERTGADFIVDLVDGQWQFFEKENGEVEWYRVKEPTRQMLEKFESMLGKEDAA